MSLVGSALHREHSLVPQNLARHTGQRDKNPFISINDPLTLDGLIAHCKALIQKSGVGLQTIYYVNPPGGGRKVTFAHVGEEMLYVLRGEVLFCLNNEGHHLHEGDLIHYRSEALHSWFNPGKRKNEVLVVNTPPSWQRER